MEHQLVLIEQVGAEAGAAEEPDWRLDEETKDTGRRGLAAARQALRLAAGRAA